MQNSTSLSVSSTPLFANVPEFAKNHCLCSSTRETSAIGTQNTARQTSTSQESPAGFPDVAWESSTPSDRNAHRRLDSISSSSKSFIASVKCVKRWSNSKTTSSLASSFQTVKAWSVRQEEAGRTKNRYEIIPFF